MGNKPIDIIPARINNLLGILQFILPLFSVVGGSFLHLPIVVIIVIAVLCFLLLLILRYQKVVIMEWLYYFFAPKLDMEHRNKVVEYTYWDRETMDLKITYEVKLSSDTPCQFFEDKLKWSAGPVSTVKPTEPTQKIISIPKEEQKDIQAQLGYECFRIMLPKLYTCKDKPIPTGFFTEKLKDLEHQAKTCLVGSISKRTDKLLLRVRFASGLNVQNIRLLKFVRHLDASPYADEAGELKIDQNREFYYVEFLVKRPIYGGKCAIDWDFIEN